jgi:hypothetical protein
MDAEKKCCSYFCGERHYANASRCLELFGVISEILGVGKNQLTTLVKSATSKGKFCVAAKRTRHIDTQGFVHSTEGVTTSAELSARDIGNIWHQGIRLQFRREGTA